MNFILYSFLIKALLCCLLFQTLDPVWLCLLWTLALPYSLGQLLCSSQLLTEAATVLPDPSPLLFPYRIWPRACFDPISRTGLLFPSFVSFLTDFLLRRAGTCWLSAHWNYTQPSRFFWIPIFSECPSRPTSAWGRWEKYLLTLISL